MAKDRMAVVEVPFYGDVIEAVQDESGVWVSIRRGCENLGVATQRQLDKLKSKPWACVTEKVMHDSTGREQKIACLHLDAVPMWLATIDARKLKEHLREKLARYQKEAAKVLADHFFGRTPSPSSEVTMDAVRAIVAEALRPFHQPVVAMPRYTLRERLRYLGRPQLTSKDRNKIRRLAASILLMRYNQTPDVSDTSGGGATLWYGHQLPVLDEAIERFFQEARMREGALFLSKS